MTFDTRQKTSYLLSGNDALSYVCNTFFIFNTFGVEISSWSRLQSNSVLTFQPLTTKGVFLCIIEDTFSWIPLSNPTYTQSLRTRLIENMAACRWRSVGFEWWLQLLCLTRAVHDHIKGNDLDRTQAQFIICTFSI